MLAMVLLATSAMAVPVMGVEWVPFSRGDLAWVQEERTTGTGMGEFDGLLVAPLRFRAGWDWGRWTLLGGLALARTTDTLWVGTNYSQTHAGALRLSADTRWTPVLPAGPGPVAWLEGGLWGDIPSARDISDTYTAEEQASADETASTVRKTLGGAGIRVGPGFTWAVRDGLSLGAAFHLNLFRGQSLTDTSLMVSTLSWSEAALLLEARFPGRGDAP